MSRNYNIAVIVGSLRKEPVNRKAAEALVRIAPLNLDFDFIDIGDMPLYDEDVEAAGVPASWKRFRAQVSSADAVLFVTPEYNRSVPGALKNAIDIGSRPYGESVWTKKPAAVVSVSPGGIGGFGANHTCASRSCFSICRSCNNPKPISAEASSCSTSRANLTTTILVPSSRASSMLSASGSKRLCSEVNVRLSTMGLPGNPQIKNKI